MVRQIAAHEAAHVALLAGLLGASAPAAPAAYDFSGGGGVGNGPFANAVGATAASASKADFLKLAQLFEDLGVRAYLGALGALAGSSALATASRVLTAEGRHAAMVRTLRTNYITLGLPLGYVGGPYPWPAFATTTAGLYDPAYTTRAAASGKAQADVAALVYGPATPKAQGVQLPSAGEDNLVQRSSRTTTDPLTLTTLTAPAFAEAFDEPMSAPAVAAVAALFGVA